MRFVADLHIHSKYARACSPALTLENIDAWSRVKGVDIVATGDFTHPSWFAELQSKLVPSKYSGLYTIREGLKPDHAPPIPLLPKPTLFMLGTELACIYSQSGKVRRVHHCIYAPTLGAVSKIIKTLAARGAKLGSDGRPIIGLSSKELLKIILDIDGGNVLIPAHAWTPWFAIFGSYSGFDSIEECFEELTPHIFAIETGLSSDPPMNWRIKELDKVALVSHSDAHSLGNLGREADVFDGEEEDLSYQSIIKAIQNAAPARFVIRKKEKGIKMIGTIEFIPDEGRYHFDGHRDCKVRLHPSQTKKLNGICPKCKKQVTIGVLARVEELADTLSGGVFEERPRFWSLVGLDKIIAEAEGLRGRKAKSVERYYWNLLEKGTTEINVLLNMTLNDLGKIATPRFVEAIKRVREGRVTIEPGYDGEYGRIKIFEENEQRKQKRLL